MTDWRELHDKGYLSSFQEWERDDPRPVNEGDFPGGAFIPEVARFFIERHTEPGDWVWDPFAGTGTTGMVCEELGRNCIMTDLQPNAERGVRMGSAQFTTFITEYDASYNPVRPILMESYSEIQVFPFDLIIVHPPYYKAIKYSDDQRDLSNTDNLLDFYWEITKVSWNLWRNLKPRGFIGLLIGDVWNEGEVEPLGFHTARTIQTVGEEMRMEPKLKSIAVKDIKGNRAGDPGYHLRLSRLARWGALDFRHEYMFSFQRGPK